MRNSVIWSFFSVVALASGGLISGCDSDDKLAKSALGESCDKTSDCDDGLKCLQGTCYRSAGSSGSGGSSNEGGDGTGGTVVVSPPAPVLGGEGESCTKRADCENGLGCFNERCTKNSATGEGGEGNVPGAVLGGVGETCGLTSDCTSGLRCLPTSAPTAPITLAAGSNSIGVCTPLDSGLEPTGKTCGHECIEAADCCELPVAAQATLGARSCADLAALVADVPDCAVAAGVNGAICLAYESYCDEQCGKNTWSCDAGLCSYTAKCTKAGNVIGGCPLYTRGGHGISACDTKAGKCTGVPVAVVGCATDAECDEGLAVADALDGDVCSEGECACYADSGGCYRKCSEDLDCEVGYVCDEETTLCVAGASCTTDAQCVLAYGDARAMCGDNGVCMPPPCEHDLDCNPGGLYNGQFEQVCGPDKTCVQLGCSENSECPAYVGAGNAGGVRSFCDAPAAGEPGAALPRSAITD